MSHKLYMDVHVPKSITDAVIRKGIDVMTAQADDSATAFDEQLLRRATEQNRLLFTQDADFLEIAVRWQTQRFYFPGILYEHQLNCSIGRTIEDLELKN
jgi:predicted nuclease of predicted toxin-antitoxin system